MIINSSTIKNDRREFKNLISEYKDHIIVVKFYADWCKPCKNIKDIVNDCFERMKGKKVLMNINVDELRDIASCYKVNALPTILTFQNGERDKVIVSGNKVEIEDFFNNL